MSLNLIIGNNANVQHFFLKSIINIVIQVIFPNVISYLDRTFKEEQNGINFKIKLVYYIDVNDNFINQISVVQMPTEKLKCNMH
jgi:hypothetical protein